MKIWQKFENLKKVENLMKSRKCEERKLKICQKDGNLAKSWKFDEK